MREWQIEGGFGLDRLKLQDRDSPVPGPGQVRLRLRAWSLNYRDLMMVQGRYNPRQPLPLVPGSDAVGEVVAVGDGVTEFVQGERACPVFAPDWSGGDLTDGALRSSLGGPAMGLLCEERVLPVTALVKPPAHLSDAECATLPCAAVTAWRALITEGGITAGSTVLTLGTGGVSLFALQIARMVGARVAILSSSDEKLERARALGAEWTLNYRDEPRWGARIRDWTGGVDHVVELGGAGTLEQSLAAVRTGGHISLIGVLAGVSAPLALTRILMRGIRVQGVFVGSRDDFLGLNRALLARPDVRPVIFEERPFSTLPAALAALETQRHMGKIVLLPG